MKSAGLRVVRGPDWKWLDQDGGEGHVGTVLEVSKSEKGGETVLVQWDSGEQHRYRCARGKYDLRILDSAPTGLAHHGLICSWCEQSPVVGTVWKCVCCLEYYLCMLCYMRDKHSIYHDFECCRTRDTRMRVRVPPRALSHKQPMYGIFPEATVIQGHGGHGNIGHVIKVQNWKNETYRSAVVVSWRDTPSHCLYCRGHLGRVDIMCVAHSCGGYYYSQHLPVLGDMDNEDMATISAGDSVMVLLDPDVFKIAQLDHGGWIQNMAELIGDVGKVNRILCPGTMAMVNYASNKHFLINSAALTKVDIPIYKFGDVVQVLEDIVEVQKLQKGHGGWNDDITMALGQVGRVVNTIQGNSIRVAVNGRRWTLNPRCVFPAPGNALIKENDGDTILSQGMLEKLSSLMNSNSDSLRINAASCGYSPIEYIKWKPLKVSDVETVISTFHIAIMEDLRAVIQVLVESNADLNLKDSHGLGPLHHCVMWGNFKVAEMLVRAGADVNLPDKNCMTPIGMASLHGCLRVLRVLVDVPTANLNSQTDKGNTPLYLAAVQQNWACVRVLLESRADPSLFNFNLSSPLHKMSMDGFLVGVEEVILYYPELVNLKKDDGYTPLHMAAVNNHLDLTALLASHPLCDINAHTRTNKTALHLAAFAGYVGVVEVLVGYGADLNLTSHDSSTPLHIALAKDDMMSPCDRSSPAIAKFLTEVEDTHGKGVLSMNLIVGLFLVANGADIQVKNMLGMSPVKMFPPDITALLYAYAERRDIFHGSLQKRTQTFTDPPRPIKQRLIPETSASLGQSSSTSGSRSSTGLPIPQQSASTSGSHSNTGLPIPQQSAATSGSRSSTGLPIPQQSAATSGSRSSTGLPIPQQSAATSGSHSSTGLPITQQLAQLDLNNINRRANVTVVDSKFGEGAIAAVNGERVAAATEDKLSEKKLLNCVNNLKESVSNVKGRYAVLPSSSLLPNAASECSGGYCFMCDSRADVKFLPCCHVTMCHECFQRAKRCPICRVTVSNWEMVCVVCHAENPQVSAFPCGHRYCSGCGGRGGLQHCWACKMDAHLCL